MLLFSFFTWYIINSNSILIIFVIHNELEVFFRSFPSATSQAWNHHILSIFWTWNFIAYIFWWKKSWTIFQGFTVFHEAFPLLSLFTLFSSMNIITSIASKSYYFVARFSRVQSSIECVVMDVGIKVKIRTGRGMNCINYNFSSHQLNIQVYIQIYTLNFRNTWSLLPYKIWEVCGQKLKRGGVDLNFYEIYF